MESDEHKPRMGLELEPTRGIKRGVPSTDFNQLLGEGGVTPPRRPSQKKTKRRRSGSAPLDGVENSEAEEGNP